MTTHGSCFRFGFQKCRLVLPKCKTLSASYHIRLKTHQKLLLSINSISIVIDSLKIHPVFETLCQTFELSQFQKHPFELSSSTPLGSKNAEEKLEKFLLRFSWKHPRMAPPGTVKQCVGKEYKTHGVKQMDKEIAYKTNDLARYTTKININRNT